MRFVFEWPRGARVTASVGIALSDNAREGEALVAAADGRSIAPSRRQFWRCPRRRPERQSAGMPLLNSR